MLIPNHTAINNSSNLFISFFKLMFPFCNPWIRSDSHRKKSHLLGMLPGLVVNVEDSQSEPWSLDVSSIPKFALKLDG